MFGSKKGVTTTLKIDGMMCGMCEAHVNDAIRKALPDARKVKSSHRKGECSFVTETAPDEAVIRKAIEDTGYTLTAVL
ncbi:MAG: heavy-metal-associated domain-containing protein [Clostridiales bacterium]|nr:heavy-metal-associated domain-containing protein [Clostridiales bacterium]